MSTYSERWGVKTTKILITVLMIALLGAVFYLYRENNKKLALLNDPALVTKSEIEQIKSKVAKLIELPSDEDPSLVTVVDKNKIMDQEFFKNAENGDKVLIYIKAKEAIIYRPSTNKIIGIGPVDLSSEQLSTIKIKVYSNNTQASSDAKNAITNKFSNVAIQSDSTTANNYNETLVIDLNNNQKDVVNQIAALIGGRVSDLPQGETKPGSTDILIILKNNK